MPPDVTAGIFYRLPSSRLEEKSSCSATIRFQILPAKIDNCLVVSVLACQLSGRRCRVRKMPRVLSTIRALKVNESLQRRHFCRYRLGCGFRGNVEGSKIGRFERYSGLALYLQPEHEQAVLNDRP
jgi:hypothetical protein